MAHFCSKWCAEDCYLFGLLLMRASHLPVPIRGGVLGWNFLFSKGLWGLPQQVGSRRSRVFQARLAASLLAGLAPGLSRSGLAAAWWRS